MGIQYNYMVFGPQNNSGGVCVYSENIGDYVAFRVPYDITMDNWTDSDLLATYFESIQFDPQDIMLSDCSTCGDRWEEDNIRFFDNVNPMNLFLEDTKRYCVVHVLDICNDGSLVRTERVQFHRDRLEGYDDIFYNEEQIRNLYIRMASRNRLSYD